MSRATHCSTAFRTILLVTFVIGGTHVVLADGVDWRSDLRKAAGDSEKTSKPMLLKFTASWCGYCRKMQTTTFQDARIVQQFNGCFIPVTIDADRNPKLKEALGIEGLPTIVIVSPKFEIVKTIVGYQTADELGKQLNGLCPKPAAVAVPTQVALKPKPARDDVEADPAFHGYCLVSMLDDRRLRKGNAQFTLAYRDRRLAFSTAEALKAFQANPLKYWPGNDGHCTVTGRETGRIENGNPQFAAIYRERAWFFAGPEQRKTFSTKPASFSATQTASRK